ncbi:MAG: MoaD/ThiS family protein [Anaerolineales bacterium]|nr:MoaD/ThiS family protein [Anaerolineales bacterium]
MIVRVKLFGTLRQYLPAEVTGGVLMLDVPNGSRAIDLLDRLDVPLDDLESLIIMVNGSHCPAGHELQENDTLSAFHALAGG